MHHFRKRSPSSATDPTNSPSSTPTSPVVEHIKQELATFYPQAKDRRALAAASIAIALAFASPSCDPTENAPDEPGSSKESTWRAAYRMARMAVEIANASSDMFLPLKAVAGALLVLIKNYDVSPLWVSHPVGFSPLTPANRLQCRSDQRGRKKDSIALWDTHIPCR